jgi:hypothetical protein
MFINTVGRVVKVTQHIGGSKLTIVRVAHDGSGQTVEDGKWGNRDTGYFDYQVWEENIMVGTRKDFSATVAALKPGATIEILADIIDRVEKENGEQKDRRVVFQALRISFVNTARPEGKAEGSSRTAQATVGDEEEEWKDVDGPSAGATLGFEPDAFDD